MDRMKSDCERYAVDLSAYFDRELDALSVAPLEAHLKECAYCQASMDQMAHIRTVLNAMGRQSLPARSLVEELREALERSDPGERARTL